MSFKVTRPCVSRARLAVGGMALGWGMVQAMGVNIHSPCLPAALLLTLALLTGIAKTGTA
jgi:hypothetical protein